MKIGRSSLPYLALLTVIISTACFLENKNRVWNNNHMVYEIRKTKPIKINQQQDLITELNIEEHRILATLNN